MSAAAAPMAAPQYSYFAGQPGVPMEPVAGAAPMYQGAPTMMYGAPQVVQQSYPQVPQLAQELATQPAVSYVQEATAAGAISYAAPQYVQAQPQYLQAATQEPQYMQAPPQYLQAAPQEAAPQYMQAQPQYLQAAPQEATAAPQYMQAQPQYLQAAPPEAITYAASPYVQAQPQVAHGAQFGSAYTQGFTSAPSMVAYPGAMPAAAPYFPMSVQQAWDNHFSAFGAKDLDKILLDYDETSVVRVYSTAEGRLLEHRGTAQIRAFFAGLFAELPDYTTLDAPVQVVEEEYKQVFLVWKCPGCQVPLASDTFIFGLDNKIKRQNITYDRSSGGVVAQSAQIASAGAAAAAAGGAAAGAASPELASAKGSKKGSKKKLGSKKKAKSGFC